MNSQDNSLKQTTLISFLLLIIVLTAFALRLFYLDKDQLWMDEAYSAIISGWSAEKFFQELPGLGSPPLYNFLLHYWMKTFGESVFYLRVFSLLFGVAFVALLYFVGKSWFNRRVGLLAAFVGSINALHIFYSQQARAYALLMFLSLASAHFLFQHLKSNSSKLYFFAYTFTSILLLYCHNWALFLLPVPYAYLIFHRNRWNLIPKIMLSHFIVFLFYIPFIPLLFKQATSGSSSWIPYFLDQLNIKFVFLKTFEIFFMGGQFLTFGKIEYGRLIPVALLIVILFYATTSLKKFKTLEKKKKRPLILLLCYTFIPLLIPYFISFVRPLYICGRYDFIVFGGFCLLIAVGLNNMPKKIFSVVLSLFILLSTFNLYGFYFKRSPRSENQKMAQLLKEKANPNDLIVFTGLTRLPIEYYLKERFKHFQIKHHPSDVEKTLGYYDYPKYLKNKETIENETFNWISNLNNNDRIWVCSNRWPHFVFEKKANFINEPLYFALSTTHQLVAIHPFRKAFILEFTQR